MWWLTRNIHLNRNLNLISHEELTILKMWKQQISSKSQKCTVELSKGYLAMCIFNQIIGRFQQYCETTKWSFYFTLLKWALFFESSGLLCGGDLQWTLVLFRKQQNPSSLFYKNCCSTTPKQSQTTSCAEFFSICGLIEAQVFRNLLPAF